ncbi:MAG: hypothetical protein GFH27_549287n281 [Chloroflexi bacterium AL-W]|nr:hypothetical protein [Chloroflexi bacterium AL-N1]NOK66555.1 hypothetical protein [Chloroflexi bacterium AL-N10]NOK71943.1 hypothetical protein [Chloroflexi bacterium AL-N5]NOK81200.1 hypothetical protein [Chloroflexi bacterium AL-W]NOK89473.1 hypothetical protein [Chloroflexi bacterium AL-N15]
MRIIDLLFPNISPTEWYYKEIFTSNQRKLQKIYEYLKHGNPLKLTPLVTPFFANNPEIGPEIAQSFAWVDEMLKW